MKIVESKTIEEAWNTAFNLIMKKGSKLYDNNEELIEFLQLLLIINSPNEITSHSNAKNDSMKKWMEDNFTQIKRVPELENSWSYGWRLYDFQGVNQIKWVVEKLKKKPESKSATISMLQKAGQEPYVPCVSLLDFKIREDQLWLTATCRSLDFGQKAIHNFYNLAALAKKVAKELNINDTGLFIHVISAHIYKKDWK